MKNYSKKEMAELMGVHVNTITNYLKTEKIDPKNVQTVKGKVMISEEELFKLKPELKPEEVTIMPLRFLKKVIIRKEEIEVGDEDYIDFKIKYEDVPARYGDDEVLIDFECENECLGSEYIREISGKLLLVVEDRDIEVGTFFCHYLEGTRMENNKLGDYHMMEALDWHQDTASFMVLCDSDIINEKWGDAFIMPNNGLMIQAIKIHDKYKGLNLGVRLLERIVDKWGQNCRWVAVDDYDPELVKYAEMLGFQKYNLDSSHVTRFFLGEDAEVDKERDTFYEKQMGIKVSGFLMVHCPSYFLNVPWKK